MRSLEAAWRHAERLLALVVCAILLALMVLTFADVLGRYLLNAPIAGTAELTELGMGILVFAGLPLVTARRGQITVTLLERFIPRSALPLLDGAIALFSALVLGLFAWRIGSDALYRGGFGDVTPYLHLPVAPFAWFMSAMALLSAILTLIQAAGHLADAGRPSERA